MSAASPGGWEYLELQGTWWKLDGVGVYKWALTRPSADTEHFDGWSQTNQDGKVSATLLNELGSEGWELVAHVVTRSVTTEVTMGWPGQAAMPIQEVWTLKRAI